MGEPFTKAATCWAAAGQAAARLAAIIAPASQKHPPIRLRIIPSPSFCRDVICNLAVFLMQQGEHADQAAEQHRKPGCRCRIEQSGLAEVFEKLRQYIQ